MSTIYVNATGGNDELIFDVHHLPLINMEEMHISKSFVRIRDI